MPNSSPVRIVESNPIPVEITSGSGAVTVDEITGVVTTHFNDDATIDSFGRLRTSQPETMLEAKCNLSMLPLIFENLLVNNGTATHLPNEAAVRLRCTTTDTDRVVRQSKQYLPYQAGKSQQILVTFTLGAGKTNVEKFVGYGDDRNGIFLKQDSTGLFIVRRTYVTGSAVDTAIPQASWNLDTCNGNGASGFNYDVTKSAILFIDLEWLGVGRVRIGFVFNGLIIYAHQFLNTNILSTVYMSTGSLPVRWEIHNVGAVVSNTDLMAICASVASEGGQQVRSPVFAVSNGATIRQVSTSLLPLLSIRVGTVFPAGGSIVNRATVIPVSAGLFSEDATVFYQVILNGTLTNPNWVNFDTVNSGVQYDISATAISNGVIIDAGYVATSAQSRGNVLNQLESIIALTLNIAGTVGDILTVAAIRVGSTNSDCGAVIQWREIY